MKFKSLILMSGMLLFAGNASAVPIEYVCTDSTGSGTNGANASSSISADGATIGATVITDYASTTVQECGPWQGNTTNDLTAALGGYGYNLYDAVTDPDGWQYLDKFEQDKITGIWGSDTGKITGAGWGTTSGTFSFADAGWDQYLIALKFDGVYSTFLSDSWADNWGWNTDTDGNNKFDLSNLVVLVRSPSNVPEPAIVGLLSIGLLGMVVARRKMKV